MTKKKNLLFSWLSRHVTPPALNEKNMTPAKTMHPGLLHPAFSPSLSGRGEGRRLREGRRGRGWQKQLEGEHGGGSGGESTHMWQDHAALLVGREKYTNFKFQSHRLHRWQAQPQPTAAGYNCDGETSSKIKYSLPEKESKLNSLKVGTVFNEEVVRI